MCNSQVDFYLVKFVDDKGLSGWFQDTVLISSVKYFAKTNSDRVNKCLFGIKMDSKDGRIDTAEGLLAIPDVNTDRFMKGLDKEFRSIIYFSVIRDVTEICNYGLLSFYSLFTRNHYQTFSSVPKDVERLGPWAIIIYDKNRFIEKLHGSFMQINSSFANIKQMAMGNVNYQNQWNTESGIGHIFKKRNCFEWQREFRFVFRIASASGETIEFPERQILKIPQLHEMIIVIPTIDLINKKLPDLPKEKFLMQNHLDQFYYPNRTCELTPGKIGFKPLIVIA